MHHARFFGEGETWPLPRPEAPAFSAAGFMVCPAPLRPQGAKMGWMEDLYRLAYAQARVEVTPSWYDRARLASVN